MALYFYFNETTGDLVYSDQATYSGSGYTSLGQQTDTTPLKASDWVFDSKRASIKTVTKDPNISGRIDVLASMSYMFLNCKALTSIDLSSFDTSNVNNMSYMFGSCGALTSIDLSNFDTSNVESISSMFSNCGALTSIDLSNFDTSNVIYMNNVFSDCDALTSLDLSGFDTSNVTSMSSIFARCNALTSLDLSSFDTSNVASMNYVFAACTSLRIIDISPNMSNVLSLLPAATYYDAVTRQSYAKANIPGGSTYVRNLADLDLVATMVQTRMGINKVKGMLDEVRRLKKQVDASVQQIQSKDTAQDREIQNLQDSLSQRTAIAERLYEVNANAYVAVEVELSLKDGESIISITGCRSFSDKAVVGGWFVFENTVTVIIYNFSGSSVQGRAWVSAIIGRTE